LVIVFVVFENDSHDMPLVPKTVRMYRRRLVAVAAGGVIYRHYYEKER
jgi:hypothetical protein